MSRSRSALAMRPASNSLDTKSNATLAVLLYVMALTLSWSCDIMFILPRSATIFDANSRTGVVVAHCGICICAVE